MGKPSGGAQTTGMNAQPGAQSSGSSLKGTLTGMNAQPGATTATPTATTTPAATTGSTASTGQGVYMGQDAGAGSGNTAPATPTQAQSSQFLPSVFSSPYLQGINTGTQVANYSSQALPAASQFQQSLYSNQLTGANQSALGAAAQLSGNQLAQTQANIGGMFENSSNSSGIAPAMLQAANTSSAQLDQTAANMGNQQTQTAAASLPSTYSTPLNATTTAENSSSGLYSAANAAMYGDSSYPLAAIGSNTYTAPTVVAQPASTKSGIFG